MSSGILFTVRKSEIGDVAAIIEIARDSLLSPWTEQYLLNELRRSDAYMFSLLSTEGKVVGFLTARVVPGSDSESEMDAEIYNFAVKRKFRQSGGAQILFDELLKTLSAQEVRNIWLDVRESNSEAIRFYRRQGFVRHAIRPSFYSNPAENGLTMKRDL